MNLSPLEAAGRARLVALWLRLVAALVFAMVVVGGATRLTESGLSIVEWQPVVGVVPPLGEADWRAAFEQYKTIPQYESLNRGMSLDDFKTIYWWEWGHRLLGRLVGAAFLLPFLWFLWRGFVDRRLALALGGIFALGALQGAVGWWMVASGLTERVSVSQYRLAFHLTLACIIYAALLWIADRTMVRASAPSPRLPSGRSRPSSTGYGEGRGEGAYPHAQTRGEAPSPDLSPQAGRGESPPRRLAVTAGLLLVLVLAQIYLGALVAGLRAGLIYNTWPLIDGSIVPSAANLFFDEPLWRNFFENALTVQFDHRMTAYTVAVLSLLHAIDAYRYDRGGSVAAGAALVAVAALVQIALGVLTLLQSAPIGLAMAHQATALVVLTMATLHACRALSPANLSLGRRIASGERPPTPSPLVGEGRGGGWRDVARPRHNSLTPPPTPPHKGEGRKPPRANSPE
jgi:cytochrome c oxidase assembly protein subunit 15